MKIVVIGGSGLIGSRLVTVLGQQGHDAVAASPRTGVDALTGTGVAEALDGADVVVDVSNSPSFEADAVLAFFETSTRTLLAAEAKAGVRHHVALSIVGADRIPDSGYMRAKVAQEALIAAADVPWTVLRATQFFEFVPAIVESSVVGDEVRLPSALIQPVAADDVVTVLAEIAVGVPADGIVDLAGPERFPLDELGRATLAVAGDPRPVVSDPQGRYFGALLAEQSLVPLGDARIGGVRLAQWRGR
ncbi:SDR family oxidoreductase [Micromonospora humida]|uniref:SDR family oxidoreductase n=1 Tax=Micromonospora humida TaxID=2809018 RepID=A0ABS2IWC3_9ACTN|nr:SDR family oxidoreductase [Micromonospora humida]MBM7078638.1 SDR family oxidoreductase [Micromonospora humida]